MMFKAIGQLPSGSSQVSYVTIRSLTGRRDLVFEGKIMPVVKIHAAVPPALRLSTTPQKC